jgi:1-acyl-sn-glycerol-3-phosphate acyltransferase
MQTKIKTISKIAVAFVTLTFLGTVALLLRIISFGYLLNFNRKHFIPFTSKLILKIIEVDIELPKEIRFIDKGQYFITFNHNSALDIFALTALGHTNTIFLLSEKTLKIFPLTITALSIGILYIPQQHNIKRRLKFFKKLEKLAKSKKINIAGSSEGVHDHHHGIDKFNKGVYHFATVCKLNIIPYFITTPKKTNLLNGYLSDVNKGLIKIEKLETIDTQNWTLADLVKNKEAVRAVFVKKFNEEHNTELT